MAGESLVIKIGGSSKQFSEELDKVKRETESLESGLSQIGKAAGLSFAALSGAMGLAVAAFREGEQVAFQTEAILKATGYAAGITAGQLDELSTAISRNSTLDDEAVKSAGNLLLTFKNLGKDVIPQTLQAVADLSVGLKQDLETSAFQLGKALNDPLTGMEQLKRAGISFTKEQKEQAAALLRSGDLMGAQGIILKEIEGKYKGLSAATAQGTGVFLQLRNELGNLAELFGKYLAPALIAGAAKLKEFVVWIQNHPELVKFAAALTVGAAAAAGLTAAVSAGALAFLQMRAALLAANVATSAMTLGMRALVGASGIGALVTVATLVAMNWETLWPRMSGVLQVFVDRGTHLLGGFGKVMAGIFTFDKAKIKEGLADVAQAMQKGWDESISAAKFKAPNLPTGTRGPTGKGGPSKEDVQGLAGQQKEASEAELEQLRLKNEEIMLEREGHGQKVLELLREQYALEKLLADENHVIDKDAVRARLEENRLLLAEQKELDKEQLVIFREEFLAENQAFQALSEEQKQIFIARNQELIQKEIKTEKELRQKAAKDKLDDQLTRQAEYLENVRKYNKVYAELEDFLHHTSLGKSISYFGTMARMARSGWSELKTIGKAAALTQLAMDTARAATQALTAFPIPFIGPALGMAAAASIIAFGLEQAYQVTAANKGGLMTGGIPGRDSILTLTTPGELITPEKNFDEVVDSVARERAIQMSGSGAVSDIGEGRGGDAIIRHVIELGRNAARYFQIRQNEDQDLGLYRG